MSSNEENSPSDNSGQPSPSSLVVASLPVASISKSSLGFPEHKDLLDTGDAHSIASDAKSSLKFSEHKDPLGDAHSIASDTKPSLRFPVDKDPLGMLAAELELVSLQEESTAASTKPTEASIKSKNYRHSHCTASGHSPAPSVRESIHLTGQPGPLPVENSLSPVPSLGGSTLIASSPDSTRERKGSKSSKRHSGESNIGSSSSTTKSGRKSSGSAPPPEGMPSVTESLSSRAGTTKESSSRTGSTKESSRSQKSRTPSAVEREPVKSRASSIKELFPGTSGSTRESSGSKKDSTRHAPSMSSADVFQQDCTTRAEKVKETLSKTASGHTKKAHKAPDVSSTTAKLAFAIAQSMGGPEMPEGLEKRLKDKKSGKK